MIAPRLFRATLTLALLGATAVETFGGPVIISTRKQVCADQGTDNADAKGPGMTTPGDVGMAILLGNHGYSSRLILDTMITADPALYFEPADPAYAPSLAIWSGSSSSADIPAPPEGVPLMMGEHVTLGNRADRAGSIFMYAGQNSNDPNDATVPAASKYMKVLDPNHPIMAGIPLDAQGRVKIFREPYPNEEKNVPAGGKKNFEYRWCTQALADKAPGTTVLGVLDGAEDRTCFAVVDKGGVLANEQPASARLVQLFLNEDGSGGTRRVFQALTELGQTLFVRAAQWAMGEDVPRYGGFRILEIAPAGAKQVKMTWESDAQHNYRVQASADLNDWQTVVEDVAGAEGTLSRTLDIGQATGTTYLRIARTP